MSEVGDLMYEITHLNTEPAVYRVSVRATDYSAGYTADVTFRQPENQKQNITCLTATGDTPEEALRSLRDELIQKYESASSLRERVAELELILSEASRRSPVFMREVRDEVKVILSR